MHSTKILLSIAALAGTSLGQRSDSEYCASYLESFYSVIATATPATPAAILDFIAAHTEIPPFPTPTEAGATPTALPSLDGKGHQSQLCALATALPSSLLPEFRGLVDGLLDFGRSYSADLIGFATDCAPDDEVAASTSYFSYIFTGTGNICENAPVPTAGGGSSSSHPAHTTPAPTPGPTYSSAPNGTASTTTSLIPTAAAVRPTGAWLGAAAVGGVLGVAALL